MPANLENSAVATGLEKVNFHSNPKEKQFQRMFKLLHSCTHFTHQQNNAKILQARLQQYVNCDLPDAQASFRKGRGTFTPADWHNTFVLGSCEMGHLNGTATLIWNNSNFLCIHRSHITWESHCSFIALIHSESILFNSLFIYLFSECHTSSSKSKQKRVTLAILFTIRHSVLNSLWHQSYLVNIC